jgi:hypothetical protein
MSTDKTNEMAQADDAPRSIEGALAAAFGARPRERYETVIEALGAKGSRVLLRDAPSEPSSPVVTLRAAATTEGRYQLLGEIARGGIGVVLKGRDTDLGRDVAMKVLRDEHARNPRIVQRFVEEAQIAGQLQHPGIVPVYEMGLRADRRPYFTMKLVKGRTLAALLADRSEPAAERRRLLVAFEHVCHTVAYAHARGVVHRDLKPSNVMVGAFGEVQVVDWGLAKVLGQGAVADEKAERRNTPPEHTVIETARAGSKDSETVAGSIMGTPAYMPPEQARGEVDRVDERADVFALGAILCEILTGVPPYAGETADVARAAARGDLADARKRLAACGADAEIAALAERCLAPEISKRPRDAAAVAAAVTSHLAAVEQRARAAQLAAVEAKAQAAEDRAKADLARADAAHERDRADQQRRARRLTGALAAAVLITFALTGGAWLWYEHDRADQDQQIGLNVESELVRAAYLRGRAAERGELEAGREGVAAAQRAIDIATEHRAAEELRRKAAAALVDAQADDARAREADAKAKHAKLMLVSGNSAAAVADMREVVALAPRNASERQYLSTCLWLQCDIPGALDMDRSVIALEPDDATHHTSLALTLIEWWQWSDEVRDQAEAALRIEPQMGLAHELLAQYYFAHGDLEAAEREFKAEAALGPHSFSALALQRGEFEIAREIPTAVLPILRGDPLPDAWRSRSSELMLTCYHMQMWATLVRLHDTYGFTLPFIRTERDDTFAAMSLRVGLGDGADAGRLDDAERTGFRSRALEQYRKLFGEIVDASSRGSDTRVRIFRRLRLMPGFLTREQVLARLPVEERDDWSAFWTEADTAAERIDAQPRLASDATATPSPHEPR